MYIVACHKCGEIKVISSIADEYGSTRVCWTCKKCGAGQLLEIRDTTISRRGSLHDIVKGIGFAGSDGVEQKYIKRSWL